MSAQSGIPAIQPSLPHVTALEPRFTVRDVNTYTIGHPHPSAIGPVQDVAVEFVSGTPLRGWSPWARGISSARLLCLVRWSGTFRIAPRPGVPDTTGQRAWQVFDAISGNLLLDVVGG
jgi:hypothetical protein